MTVRRLEIIAVNGDKLGEVTLIPQGNKRTLVEGDLLNEGTYGASMNKMRNITELRAKMKYRQKYTIEETTIDYK